MARQIARRIGYPLLVKAVAGGGGRGMRVVQDEADLVRALPLAQAEAEAAFGNGEVYLERFIDRPRHVEVQVLADHFGNVLAVGERDCSIQRRHQKLIEEAPAPNLPRKTRDALLSAAVKGAKAARYTNAGTLEFLVDASRQLLLHGDEHADPGRAPGYGDDDRDRSRCLADPHRRGTASHVDGTRPRADAAMPSNAGSPPKMRQTTSRRASARSRPMWHRVGPACGSIRTSTLGTACRRTMTRCWARSSPGDGTAKRRRRGWSARLTETVITGVPQTVSFLRSIVGGR